MYLILWNAEVLTVYKVAESDLSTNFDPHNERI